MKKIKLSDFIKLSNILDSKGKYKEADNLYIKLSNYYPEQSITKTKDISYFEWDGATDEQFKDNDENYITKKPNLLQKEYFDLGDGSDPKKIDELNTQARLNGPSGVTGPAAIDPGNVASSPSMAGGDLKYFEWDEVYDENHPEYNRIPRR